MPKEYVKLKEEELPHQFYELIRERESIYHELIVKKKVRKGELSLDGTGGQGRSQEGSLGGVTVGSLNRNSPPVQPTRHAHAASIESELPEEE